MAGIEALLYVIAMFAFMFGTAFARRRRHIIAAVLLLSAVVALVASILLAWPIVNEQDAIVLAAVCASIGIIGSVLYGLRG